MAEGKKKRDQCLSPPPLSLFLGFRNSLLLSIFSVQKSRCLKTKEKLSICDQLTTALLNVWRRRRRKRRRRTRRRRRKRSRKRRRRRRRKKRSRKKRRRKRRRRRKKT